MRITALALTDEPRRFIPSSGIRGARLLLTPNVEISRLAAILGDTDHLRYLDERVNPLELDGRDDLVLAHVPFGADLSARRLAERLYPAGAPLLFFGPAVTATSEPVPVWMRHRVLGDLLNVWPQIRTDVISGRLADLYRANPEPVHSVMLPGLICSPEMNTEYVALSFCRGCACPDHLKTLCPEYLYYGNAVRCRSPEEIVGEIITLPGKKVTLLDEDVARFPEYYSEVFTRLWDYRRHWFVTASSRIFEHPRLIKLLSKVGVKAILLDETFISDRLQETIINPRVVREFYRATKMLQSRRMLVGVRLTLDVGQSFLFDYETVAKVLLRADVDFILTRFVTRSSANTYQLVYPDYRPGISATDPVRIRQCFYSLRACIDRLVRRPRRVGFYSTFVYLLPLSMAYRQQFFEGIPDH